MGRKPIPKYRLDKALSIWEKSGWTMEGLKEASRHELIGMRKLYYERNARQQAAEENMEAASQEQKDTEQEPIDKD